MSKLLAMCCVFSCILFVSRASINVTHFYIVPFVLLVKKISISLQITESEQLSTGAFTFPLALVRV